MNKRPVSTFRPIRAGRISPTGSPGESTIGDSLWLHGCCHADRDHHRQDLYPGGRLCLVDCPRLQGPGGG